MIINIIHNPQNKARSLLIANEIKRQSFKAEYIFWPAIYKEPVRSGISEAHKQIVRANLKEPYTVIMEDDVRIPSRDGLKYFFYYMPEKFDLYLSGIYSGGINRGITKSFSGLHLYVVAQRFYDTFLKADPMKHLDRCLGGKGLFKVCYPFAAIQHNGHSENTGKEENYDEYLVGKEIYGL